MEIKEQQREIRESMGLSEGLLKMLEARGRKKAMAREVEAPAAPTSRPQPVGAPEVTKGRAVNEEEDEEGSPEYIRRHFFPNEPVNANLAWMKGPPPSTSDPTQPSDSEPT